jgi:hypothetical protein
VRHVEQVAAPFADQGATVGVQRQNCRHSYGALISVLELVTVVEAAASQSEDACSQTAAASFTVGAPSKHSLQRKESAVSSRVK